MTPERLNFHRVDAFSRQAVGLLAPEADLTITETSRNNAYVQAASTGGDHGYWRISPTIAADKHAALTLDPRRWAVGSPGLDRSARPVEPLMSRSEPA